MRICEDIELNWNICCKYRRINVQRKSICETCKLRQSQLDIFLYTHNYGSAAFLLEHDNLSVNWSWQKVIKRFLIKGKLFVLQKFKDNAIEIHDDFDIPLVHVSILIQSIVKLAGCYKSSLCQIKSKLKGIIPYKWLNLECSSKDKVNSQTSKEWINWTNHIKEVHLSLSK